MLNSELHFLLLRCFHNSNKQIVRQTASLNLLSGQPKILECLWEQNGQSPKEIGLRCILDKSTITSLLNKMEEQGLIFRKAQTDDRRSVKIFLTEEGWKKAGEVKKICEKTDEFALRNFTPEQKQQLIQLLNQLLDTYQEATYE